jgi:hypothetical protein
VEGADDGENMLKLFAALTLEASHTSQDLADEG